MAIRHFNAVVLILVAGVGFVCGQQCTLRVGAFEGKTAGAIGIGDKPRSSEIVTGFEASALHKTTKKLYPSVEIDGLRYFAKLPEGPYRLVLSKPGFKTVHYRYELSCGGDPWTVSTWSVALSRGAASEIIDLDPEIKPGEMRLDRITRLGSPDSNVVPVDVSGGQAVYLPEPKLSAWTRGVDFEGSVKVSVFVSDKGAVVTARAISGHPMLLADCETAAYYSRFSPRVKNGKPVPFFTVISYPFGSTSETPVKSVTRTISGGILNGKAVSLPKPEYPSTAKALGARGAVSVQILVDINGEVISATAITGHQVLRPHAVNAARSARFAPVMEAGVPVKVSGVITYNFVP